MTSRVALEKKRKPAAPGTAPATDATNAIDAAAKPVIESLEGRVLLSGGAWTRADLLSGPVDSSSAQDNKMLLIKPYPRKSPTDIMPAGFVGGFSAARHGTSVAQMQHLYGVDLLEALNPNFPLFTNHGENQSIAVVGAPPSFINDVPMVRTGNLNLFSAGEGIIGGAVLESKAEDLSTNNDPTGVGDIETTAILEWAHAMAESASLFCSEVNTNNGVIAPADLAIGIQDAIDNLESTGSHGPFNPSQPGGVIVLSLSSVAEIAANQAQFDALFSQADAANISFICSAGDTGGALAMPAVSPYATAVGGDTFRVDGAGNRISEIAWLDSGGGQSTIEPLPGYQVGVKLGKKPLTGGRALPDLVMAARTRSLGNGLDIYWDPTPMGNDPRPWGTFQGSSVSAAMFGGAVADANELREVNGMSAIGNQLNAKLYSLYLQNPRLYFTDITQGNNTLHPALKGFDLASGMGAPRLDQIIPGLANIVGSQSANIKANAQQYANLTGGGLTGNGVAAFRGTGTATIGTQFVGLNLSFLGVDGVSTAVLDVPTITRQLDNSITGEGTVTSTIVTSTGPITQTFNVAITGKVSGSVRKPKVHGQIFTIDPLTGARLSVGPQPVFQGTFS